MSYDASNIFAKIIRREIPADIVFSTTRDGAYFVRDGVLFTANWNEGLVLWDVGGAGRGLDGLVDRLVPADQVYAEAVAWAGRFVGAASYALRAAKESMNGIDPVEVTRSGTAATGQRPNERRRSFSVHWRNGGPGIIKGVAKGDLWDEFLQLSMRLAQASRTA